MSTVAATRKTRIPISISGEGVQVQVPSWVVDHRSFRRWASSDSYPQHGWFSYLDGKLWVDISMEEFFTHNQVKARIDFTMMTLLEEAALPGRYVPDRMLLTNEDVGLSTEPDGLFFFWETFERKRIRLVERPKQSGCLELAGTPDMVLEVVSDSSEKKDKEDLRELYWRAGITEYWLVDVRGSEPSFEILRHTARGYVAARPNKEGWTKSAVFGRSFKLTQRKKDPLGPIFTLLVQS